MISTRQNSKTITFDVSHVEIAKDFLQETDTKDVIDILIENIGKRESCSLESKSFVKLNREDFADGTPHLFLFTLHLAFAQHRPVVLSPDMIWLLVCQGFAKHVNQNAEKFRDMFVSHAGKEKIEVRRDDFIKGVQNPWEEVFPIFCEEIEKKLKDQEIKKIVTSPFSTTGVKEQAAFEITLMDSMKSYFEYEFNTYCGIPSITLAGTPGDWKDLLERTKKLQKYEANWWISRLIPTLEKFVETSEGKIDRKFWESMYKYENMSGGPRVNGWIIQFFPYIYGHHHNLIPNPMCHNLVTNKFPNGLSQAEFVWNYRRKKFSMVFIAGFTGISQDQETKALKPEIGWVVAEQVHTFSLIKACREGNLEAAKSFLQDKESLRQPDRYGRTPLLVSLDNEHWELANLLIEKGSNVNEKLPSGDTLLIKACYEAVLPENIDHSLKMIKFLVEKGADVNTNGSKYSPLMVACMFDNLQMAMVLVENGADLNAKNNYHKTALMEACINNSSKIARFFIEKGADWRKKDNDGKTALDYAQENQLTEIVEILEKMAKVKSKRQKERIEKP